MYLILSCCPCNNDCWCPASPRRVSDEKLGFGKKRGEKKRKEEKKRKKKKKEKKEKRMSLVWKKTTKRWNILVYCCAAGPEVHPLHSSSASAAGPPLCAAGPDPQPSEAGRAEPRSRYGVRKHHVAAGRRSESR